MEENWKKTDSMQCGSPDSEKYTTGVVTTLHYFLLDLESRCNIALLLPNLPCPQLPFDHTPWSVVVLAGGGRGELLAMLGGHAV